MKFFRFHGTVFIINRAISSSSAMVELRSNFVPALVLVLVHAQYPPPASAEVTHEAHGVTSSPRVAERASALHHVEGIGHVALSNHGMPGLEIFPPQPIAEETPLGRRVTGDIQTQLVPPVRFFSLKLKRRSRRKSSRERFRYTRRAALRGQTLRDVGPETENGRVERRRVYPWGGRVDTRPP